MNHAVTEDDWYKGYFIPKDSVIMLNWWAIHYDEKRFPNPEEFIPDRYFDKKLPAADYISHPDPYERDHFTYGAGRRSCPGVHLAEKSMVLSLRCGAYGFSLLLLLVCSGASIFLGLWTRMVNRLSRIL